MQLRCGNCDHVIPHVLVRQWVLIRVMRLPMPMPMPMRLLLAAQPKLVTTVLQVLHRVITRHPPGQAGLESDEAGIGAVILIQRLGPAANFTQPWDTPQDMVRLIFDNSARQIIPIAAAAPIAPDGILGGGANAH